MSLTYVCGFSKFVFCGLPVLSRISIVCFSVFLKPSQAVFTMVLLREHKVFMVEAYFRNGTKVDGNWEYSVSACFEEFQERFPIAAIVYEQFRQTLHLCLNNFRESGTIGLKEGSGQVKKVLRK
jgi:hypothetical protein